jgi:hypothetical protein
MIYTLGASFTKWYWPTWADWLDVYNGPVTNWSFAGYGNQHIHWILLDKYKQITKDDTVIIMWATSNNNTQWYDKQWIDQYQCEGFFPKTDGKLWFTNDIPWLGMYRYHPDHDISLSQMIIGNFHTILQTQMLLEKIGCKYKMVFSQNPWLDVRPTFVPEFEYAWDKKTSITKEELATALDILKLTPVQSLLELIDWTKFVDSPIDIYDPKTYTGLWEYSFTKKEFVVQKHNTNNHPNSLIAHDYLVERIMPQPEQHRSAAFAISTQVMDTSVPEFDPEDYVADPSKSMCLIDVSKFI